MKKFVIPFVICVIVLGGYLVWRRNIKPSSPLINPLVNKVKLLPKEVTVTLDKTGFTPHTVTLERGSAVRWKNASGETQTVNSDDHPTHRLYRELNFGEFSSGSSVVYIFKKPGIFSYHNHFHPEQKGEILVKE